MKNNKVILISVAVVMFIAIMLVIYFLVIKKPAATSPSTSGPLLGGGSSVGSKIQDVVNQAQDVATTVSNNLPKSKYPTGTLLRSGNDQRVYVIDEIGQRKWVSTRAKFDSLGFNMANVKSISNSEMLMIKEGPSI
jgi:hypothetical protein